MVLGRGLKVLFEALGDVFEENQAENDVFVFRSVSMLAKSSVWSRNWLPLTGLIEQANAS